MSIPLPLAPKAVSEEGNRAVFDIEGLYPGYGHTIGNSMRRVLLSSLRGAAITSVKIEGVSHEFSTIEGIMEDAVEIILNLKQLRFRLYQEEPVMISLSVKGEREVIGKDFKLPSQVELINPDLHIATISSKKSGLSMEATVEAGMGYIPVEERTKEKVEIGVIALDAAFSPVRYVNYDVENMRVGDRTDYNRLRLTVETDGSITPREAFLQAASILVEQFSVLIKEMESSSVEIAPSEEYARGVSEEAEKSAGGEEDTSKMKLDDLKLSGRTLNILKESGIKTVGGLSRKKESALRELEGMGDKGMQEIKKALGNFGITLKP
ncbi:MAG: DNA-directed RNA polymerase subunit alpha [Candidatus Sungbacteria bacterium]|nr:DNA-directed RNA polymerase subunit alpha [Candidatus Sungbacteria bacterium]